MSRIHSITIREAMSNEFDELGQMMIDVYSQLEDFPSMDEQPDYYKMLANIGDFTKKPDTKLLVAISPESKILGGVVYFGDMKYYGSGGTATKVINASGIRLLAVDPNTRGMGVGKALTLVCIQNARDRNQSEVILHTTKAMEIAWGMYEKMGFKRSPDLDFKQEQLAVYGFRLKLDETSDRIA